MSASALQSLWSKSKVASNATSAEGDRTTSNVSFDSDSGLHMNEHAQQQQQSAKSALQDGYTWNTAKAFAANVETSQQNLHTAATLPRGGGRSPFAANTSPADVFSSPADSLSPVAPWGHTSSAATLSSPVSRTSPEMRAFYGSQSDVANSSSTFGVPNVGATAEAFQPSTLFSHARRFGTEYGTTTATMFDTADDDVPFYSRDASTLPRRNHTIASSAAAYRRRLDRQFDQGGSSSTGLMSPNKNSLSAITGGAEEGDDDWEAMLKRKESLIPNDVEEEHEVLNTSAWRPIGFPDSFSASHRRFPSQPISTIATSPVDSHSPVSVRSGGHQRSESAGINRLDQGPFASSTIVQGTGFGSGGSGGAIVRRHQSLNHHAGRNTFARMTTAARHPMPVADRPYGGEGEAQHSLVNARRIDAQGMAFEHGASTQQSAQSTYPARPTHQQFVDLVDQLSLQSLQLDDGKQVNAAAAKPVLTSLVTDRDELLRSVAQHPLENDARRKALNGPASASAYVPPIGHGHHRRHSSSGSPGQNTPTSESVRTQPATGEAGRPNEAIRNSGVAALRGLQTAHPAFSHPRADPMSWHQRADTPTHDGAQQAAPFHPSTNARSPQVAQQSLLNGHAYSFAAPTYYLDPASQAGTAPLLDMRGNVVHAPQTALHWPMVPSTQALNGVPMFYPSVQPPSGDFAHTTLQHSHSQSGSLQNPAFLSLITAKGYNPPVTQFNVNPSQARFFVIKSFTEDDVQRSLKHEIWASTEKGNQRLDRAFKESSASGPLYLLFSVNASGHFCGIAQMLTPIDYTSDSTVWVQEGKWKGTFKVRWIYVKDVPNNRLRHIRLTNTADCKPITQSRDTQELPVDGGRQAMKIIAEYPSRTTLLQDWLFNDVHQGGTNTSSDGTNSKAGLERAA